MAIRRLRRRASDVPVIAAFWMSDGGEPRLARLSEVMRCTACASDLPHVVRLCLDRAAAPVGPGATSAGPPSSG